MNNNGLTNGGDDEAWNTRIPCLCMLFIPGNLVISIADTAELFRYSCRLCLLGAPASHLKVRLALTLYNMERKLQGWFW